jgi:hypothetical protein
MLSNDQSTRGANQLVDLGDWADYRIVLGALVPAVDNRKI